MRRVLLEEGTGIVEALKAVRGPLFGLFLAAVDVGDIKTAANLAGPLHESLSLSAKVTGELTPHAAVSITNAFCCSRTSCGCAPSCCSFWRGIRRRGPRLQRCSAAPASGRRPECRRPSSG